jgi:hypothetical protein
VLLGLRDSIFEGENVNNVEVLHAYFDTDGQDEPAELELRPWRLRAVARPAAPAARPEAPSTTPAEPVSAEQ